MPGITLSNLLKIIFANAPVKIANPVLNSNKKYSIVTIEGEGYEIFHLLTTDKEKAVKGAHVLYTDIWVSMGEPFDVWEQRIKMMRPYQVDMKSLKLALKTTKNKTIFMHCLPAYHGLDTEVGRTVAKKFGKKYSLVKNGEIEVTNEVFESKYSKVFDEAENRMHSIKAVIYSTLGCK